MNEDTNKLHARLQIFDKKSVGTLSSSCIDVVGIDILNFFRPTIYLMKLPFLVVV